MRLRFFATVSGLASTLFCFTSFFLFSNLKWESCRLVLPPEQCEQGDGDGARGLASPCVVLRPRLGH